MDKLDIKLFPDPALTNDNQKVSDFDSNLGQLIDAMTEAMRRARGVGLAAPQVGHNVRLAIIEHRAQDDDDMEDIPLQVLINPKIISCSKETDIQNEGCLSIPGIEIPVERAHKIKVKAFNRQGQKVQFRATGFKARIIQHELDHLDGKLILDYAKNKEKVIKKYLAKKSPGIEQKTITHDDQSL